MSKCLHDDADADDDDACDDRAMTIHNVLLMSDYISQSIMPQSYFGKCLSLVLFRPEIKPWQESLDLHTGFVRS